MDNSKFSSKSMLVEHDSQIKEIVLRAKPWLNYYKMNWGVILAGCLLGAITGFVYSYLEKPSYTAKTTFVLEEDKGGGGVLGQLGGLASLAGVDVGGGGGLFQGDNIIALYKSRSMMQKALLTKIQFEGGEKLLIDKYIEFNKLRNKWKDSNLKQISFADTASFTVRQDSIIGEIVKELNTHHLTVSKPEKKLSILIVEVKSEDQEFAKHFNEQIVTTVNNFYVETKTKKSLQNIAILQRQTDSVRAIMSGAINTSAATLDATPNLNPTKQLLRAPVQRSQFNAETNKAILTELVKNLELSKMSLRRETPLIQVIDKPIYPLDVAKSKWYKTSLIGSLIMLSLIAVYLFFKKWTSDLML